MLIWTNPTQSKFSCKNAKSQQFLLFLFSNSPQNSSLETNESLTYSVTTLELDSSRWKLSSFTTETVYSGQGTLFTSRLKTKWKMVWVDYYKNSVSLQSNGERYSTSLVKFHWIIYIKLYIFERRLLKGNNEMKTSWLLSTNCCNTIKVRQHKYSSKISRAIILANKTFQHHNMLLSSSNTNNLYNAHLCLFKETFKTEKKKGKKRCR